jgi:hypothetical protein
MENKIDGKEKVNNQEKPQQKKFIVKLGNILLFIIGVLIVITGTLLYYLIYTNSQDLKNDSLASNTSNTTGDNFNTDNTTVADIIGNVIDTGNNQANNSTVTSTDASSRKVQNENIIVLYDGLLLDVSEMKRTELQYIDSTNAEKDKYVITYYNYENYSFVNSALGSLSTQVYDGLLKINNVGKIAISESYDALPRTIQVVNALPTIITDNNKLDDYDSVKAIITDLDGNGIDEYILILANKNTGYSKISFVNSTGSTITDLAYIEKSKWGQVSEQGYYLSISNVEIVDVDNDGVMEILVEIPKYEGEPDVSILKYKNGELSGETNIECSLLP